MPTTINILLLSSDPRFREELENAIASLDELHAVIYSANDVRQAMEAARSRRPRLALVEMGGDVRPLRAFAEEVAVISPETTVAAVFRPDAFGQDGSESALFIEAIRAGVKDFLRRPVSSSEVAELLRRIERAAMLQTGHVGKIISFVSNKGGVGKSTLAVNAACGLAMRRPGSVLLVDAALQMGNCASLLDLTPTASLIDAARESGRLDETLIRQLAFPHSTGLHLLAAPPDPIEADEVDDEVLTRVLTLARHTYDFVVVDTFPMLDRAMVAVLDLSDRAYVVLENVVPTLLGGVKFIEVLQGLGVSRQRQRIVLNRCTSLPGSVRPPTPPSGWAATSITSSPSTKPWSWRRIRASRASCGGAGGSAAAGLDGLVDDIEAMSVAEKTPPVSPVAAQNGHPPQAPAKPAEPGKEKSP